MATTAARSDVAVTGAPASSAPQPGQPGERFANGMRADETRKLVVEFLRAWARAASAH